jgi:hypothetical protein
VVLSRRHGGLPHVLLLENAQPRCDRRAPSPRAATARIGRAHAGAPTAARIRGNSSSSSTADRSATLWPLNSTPASGLRDRCSIILPSARQCASTGGSVRFGEAAVERRQLDPAPTEPCTHGLGDPRRRVIHSAALAYMYSGTAMPSTASVASSCRRK